MATSEPVLEVDRSDSFTNGLLLNLWDMKTRGESTDMTIIATNVPIRCHSVVMAAASEHFRELLKGPMKDVSTKEVELNFDEVYIQKVVEYCYTGKISIELSSAESYLRIIEYFHLNELKMNIENFVFEHLKRETCIGWHSTAKEFSLFALEKRCQELIATNLKQMIEGVEFHQLSAKEVKVCIKSCIDPDVALDACVSWATSNPLSRSKDFLGLLRDINLIKCSPPCIEQVLQTWKPIWPNYTEVHKALKPFASVVPKALANVPPNPANVPKAQAHLAKYPAKPSTNTMLLFGGFTQTNVLNRKVWKVDLKARKCEVLTSMDHKAVKYWPGYCSTPEKLFVIGGSNAMRSDKYQELSDCHAICVHDLQVEAWQDVDERIAETSAIYVDNYIYTFGGIPDEQAVYRLNLKTKMWTRCPDMPNGNAYPIIANIGDKVYMVFNTHPNNMEFKRSKRIPMYRFDTSSLTWRPCKNLPQSILDTCDAKAVSVGEDIYLVGGRMKLCARYSPQHKTWKILENPQMEHQACSAVHINGDIVLCGGRDFSEEVHDIIEVYNIVENAWTVHSVRMPVGLQCHHCAVYDEEARKILL